MTDFSAFDPDLEVYPPPPPGHPGNDSSGYAEQARELRKKFQRSLLMWLNRGDIDGLRQLSVLTRELQQLAAHRSVAQLWWIAGAHAELMALTHGSGEVVHTHVPARLDQLLRKLIEQGEDALVSDRDRTLLREMLYDIGESSCDSVRLREIRWTFGLANDGQPDTDTGGRDPGGPESSPSAPAHEAAVAEAAIPASSERPDADCTLPAALREEFDRLREAFDAADETTEDEPHLDSLWELRDSMALGSAPADAPHAAPETPDRRDGEAPGAVAGSRGELLRIPEARLDRMADCAAELGISRARMQEHQAVMRSSLGDLGRHFRQLRERIRELELDARGPIPPRARESAAAGSDSLKRRVGELSLSMNELADIHSRIDSCISDSDSLLLHQAELGAELQDGLMKTRLAPFETVLPTLRQQAFQWARELGKEVEIRTGGGDVEIDRRVMDAVTGALNYAVRHAVRHSLELPDDREHAGKPRRGTLYIECKRRGNRVEIRVADDGRGPDVEVKEIEGSGPGPDPVHDALARLGGSMSIDCRAGEGTVAGIGVPASLSLPQAVFVRCGRQEFAIPLSLVRRVMKADVGTVLPSADGRQLYEANGKIYPLLDLPRQLGIEIDGEEEQRAAILLVRAGASGIAVRVSELLGPREIVVRSTGRHLERVEGIAGATVLGDGRVVLILDLQVLWNAVERRAASDSSNAPSEQGAPLVLVVDDSVTVRRIAAVNLQRRGMEVVMARDGVEALELLRDCRPDVMLVDIEMPHMDGYELAERVRDDPGISDIPIVMVTSRAGDGRRERAMAVGAVDYLEKPYREEELLSRIEQCLAARRFRASEAGRVLP